MVVCALTPAIIENNEMMKCKRVQRIETRLRWLSKATRMDEKREFHGKEQMEKDIISQYIE